MAPVLVSQKPGVLQMQTVTVLPRHPHPRVIVGRRSCPPALGGRPQRTVQRTGRRYRERRRCRDVTAYLHGGAFYRALCKGSKVGLWVDDRGVREQDGDAAQGELRRVFRGAGGY